LKLNFYIKKENGLAAQKDFRGEIGKKEDSSVTEGRGLERAKKIFCVLDVSLGGI